MAWMIAVLLLVSLGVVWRGSYPPARLLAIAVGTSLVAVGVSQSLVLRGWWLKWALLTLIVVGPTWLVRRPRGLTLACLAATILFVGFILDMGAEVVYPHL